uniref:Cadherin 26 n=1 Tax=Labrus bergylta TaxID=56723 RepID=A0A3Q3ERG9_9LABR
MTSGSLLVRSKRRWVLSTIELEEEDKGPYPKPISKMFNNMSGDHHEFHISGMGVDEPPLGVFEIDKVTGDVFANRALDREKYPKPFHIKFDIIHQHTRNRLDKVLAFDVELKDINDNAPEFVPPQITEQVKESTRGMLLYVHDIDKENTPNSQISVSQIFLCQFLNKNVEKVFLYIFQKVKKYEVIVKANDHGEDMKSSTAVITLNIVDTNTHLPTFKSREVCFVQEASIKDDILRIGVEDKDTPKTPGWNAIYYFMEGNEDENYKIETDPDTNEGILSVIKKKDYEKTNTAKLKVGVKNAEPLTICKDYKDDGKGEEPTADSVTIDITVIDINDPPVFDKDPVDVYQKEEEQPGMVLYTPTVHDAEGNLIRFDLLEDPAGWVTIDEKTGTVTSTKKMDRESPFVDNTTSIYKILIRATDDGKPQGTGTCTVRIHLRDINDNLPQLVNKGVIMCGNKVSKVMVQANDSDAVPYSGPFTFSLGGDDKDLAQRWKLDPATGSGLVSLKQLPYGNYPVPLLIQDQQNMVGRDTVEVTVCDCGEKNVSPILLRCYSYENIQFDLCSYMFGCVSAVLLLIIMCQCGKKFTIPTAEDEGNQTLIKYNQEGGGSECKVCLTCCVWILKKVGL